MFFEVLLLVSVRAACSLQLEVQTRLGEVRGLLAERGDYAMFLGVPYALVDEQTPFGVSVPHPGYSEPILAYDDYIVCPQPTPTGTTGVIQCLKLNIFVPEVPAGTTLPVMVWVHGGAWIQGGGGTRLSSPTFLVRHGVIVVNIQYRVGMYGFLCTDSPKAPGNVGLRDQLLAFKWIKEHIDAFGGDSDQITVFGESAGGMSLHLHVLSHHEQLFQRVIIQSGSSSSPWSTVDQHNHLPIEIANELGYDTADVEDAIDFLSAANVDDVVRTAANLVLVTTANYAQPLTKACVEKEFEGIERFVAVHPDLAHSDKAKDIDVMIGITSEELIFQYAGRQPEFYDTYSFIDLLDFGFNITEMDDMADLLAQFYIGDEATSPDLEHQIIQCGSDYLFNNPTERAIKRFLEDGVKSLYKFVFSYEGGRNFLKRNINTNVPGASHADELGYLFDMEMFSAQEDTLEDIRIIDQITTMWTNFAKFGNPIPELTELLPVSWRPVTAPGMPTDHHYLDIDRTLTLRTGLYHDRMAFWDLFYEANRHKADGFSSLR